MSKRFLDRMFSVYVAVNYNQSNFLLILVFRNKLYVLCVRNQWLKCSFMHIEQLLYKAFFHAQPNLCSEISNSTQLNFYITLELLCAMNGEKMYYGEVYYLVRIS